MMESILDIGISIDSHNKAEESNGKPIKAIGRAYCNVLSDEKPNERHVFWLTNCPDYGGKTYNGDGQSVYKNCKMGEVLAKYHDGTHSYDVKTSTIQVSICNRAIYTLARIGGYPHAKDLDIYINDGEEPQRYRFNYIADLLSTKEKAEENLKRNKILIQNLKDDEESFKSAQDSYEAAIEHAKEIAKIEAERKKAEDAQLRYAQEYEESRRRIEVLQSFIRSEFSLRSQHILDESQETAKRSHIYDGHPIIISGGPGTGKTTTMIQRLRFLLDIENLYNEYDLPKGKYDILSKTDERNRWIFFSPSELLLNFLKKNMTAEQLTPIDGKNLFVLDDFRSNMMLAYELRNLETGNPFKLAKRKDEQKNLILKPFEIESSFTEFLLKELNKKFQDTVSVNTSKFFWHKSVVPIKADLKKLCTQTTILDYIGSLHSLREYYIEILNVNKKEYSTLRDSHASFIVMKINENEQIKEDVINLFLSWEKEDQELSVQLEDNHEDLEEEDNILTHESEEIMDNSNISNELKLYQEIKKILPKILLQEYDGSSKLSKREKSLYSLCKVVFDGRDFSKLSELTIFLKYFSFIASGIESAIFFQIPNVYKKYRKSFLSKPESIYNLELLSKLVSIGSNKTLHKDEQDFIIYFINKIICSVYKRPSIFERIKNHKYVLAYRENIKHVIGIDEGTDYSVLDYMFMSSFQHPDVSSLTICGDIMQGLNANGILRWSNLNKCLPQKPVLVELTTSYRQIPTLVEISRQMYLDEQKKEAPFKSREQKNEHEPKAICFISDDNDSKLEWIAKRIVEVYRNYGNKMPSVAIFVGDKENIQEIVDSLSEIDILNGIKIIDGKTSDTPQSVRIYRLSEVKGLEFEVAFFYNLDEALSDSSSSLLRRYLYVGISRATTHLAATFSKVKGNEKVLKYFDMNCKNWK